MSIFESGNDYSGDLLDGDYGVELRDLSTGEGAFKDEKTGKLKPVIYWDFAVFDIASQEPIVREDGEEYIFRALSSTVVFKNSKTGKQSKAYEWAEALLGREPTTDEIRGNLDQLLIGRRAKAMFTVVAKENGTFSQIRAMVSLTPRRASAGVRPAAAVAAASVE